MRTYIALCVLIMGNADSAAALQTTTSQDTATTRKELERWYQQNTAAYQRWDVQMIMALRAPDFHSITPDGRVQDRAAMENYIQGILNGVKKWNRLSFTLDSLRVVGDTAFAIVSQHADRMALRPDNAIHHVETWVTQREAWIRTGGKWLMWRVDQLRNQRRLIDSLDWRASWPGTQMAVVAGNPSTSGPFTFRFEMPAGYWICPHTHPVRARIRVLTGDLQVGMGRGLDTARVTSLAPNGEIVLEPGMAHFEGTRRGTVIEIRGDGPWGITFMDPRKDPALAGGTACR